MLFAFKRRFALLSCAFSVLCLLVCADSRLAASAVGQEIAPPASTLGSPNRQPSGRNPSRTQDDEEEPVISEAKLKTYYLVRENGELAPFFDLPFEEFEAIYRLYAGIDDQAEQPNRFHVNEISVAGTVRDALVDLETTFSVRAAVDGWVRVPLKLDECRLQNASTGLDPARAFLTVESDGEGLVCWLNGKQGEISELTLKLIRPLETASTSDPFRLRLTLPKAASSKLTLDVPLPDMVFTARDEAILQETSHPDAETTRFVVLGRPSGGGFDFSWGSPRQRAAIETRLIVTSQTEILAESERQLHWQASLDVESGGRSIESFDVLLPQNATLITQEAPGYTLELIDEGGQIAPPATSPSGAETATTEAVSISRPRVRIRMLRPETRLSNIKIDARIRWATDPNDPLLDSSGFRDVATLEVINAVRHTGEVNVYAVDREWVVDTEPRNGLSHDAVPGVGDLGGTSVAGFTFSRQPSSLGVRSEKQPTRISIEPVVTLIATRTGVQMEGTYRVALSGSPATRLLVDVGDWEIESFTAEDNRGAGSIIRDYEEDAQVAGRFTIFLNTEAIAGQSSFVLRVLGRQPLVTGDRQIVLAFPTLVDATVSPTTLLVRQEESLIMRPERAVLQPALATSIPEWYRSSDDIPPDAVYRGPITSAGEKVAFAVTVRPRTVSYRIRVEPRLNDRNIQVRSEIDLDIKHQSLREMLLLVPTILLEESDLVVRTDDEEWIWTRSDIGTDIESPLAALPLEFTEGKIGRLLIELEYQVPTRDRTDSGTSGVIDQASGREDWAPQPTRLGGDWNIEIPFVQPFVPRTPVPLDVGMWPIISPAELLRAALDDQMQHRFIEVSVTHPINVDVQPSEESWDLLGIIERDGSLVSRFTTSQPHPEGILRFHARGGIARSGYQVSIQKCWIQTQLTNTDRQDRAVFSFRTDQREIHVDLPLGATLTRVALDNRAIVAPRVDEVDGRQRLHLRLSKLPDDSTSETVRASSQDDRYALELWYRFTERDPIRWPLRVDWPVLQDVSWVDRTYWQLVLPRTEHLAWIDDGFQTEQDWKFGPLFFERRSRMTQEELEEWMGVVPQADVATNGNSYLFSSFGKVSAGQVGTIDRRTLLLVGCTFTFLVGVALVYLRALRSPIVLLALALVVAGTAMVQLELAVLVAQIAFIALIAVAAMMLIRAAISTPLVSLRGEMVSEVSEAGSSVTRLAGAPVSNAKRTSNSAERIVVSSSQAESN